MPDSDSVTHSTETTSGRIPRFATCESRTKHQAALCDELDSAFRDRSTAAWFEVLQEHGVPAGPVRITLDVLEADFTRERNLVQRLATAAATGTVPVPRYPANFRSAGSGEPRQSPELGADTARYLEALGDAPPEIETHAQAGVVHVGDQAPLPAVRPATGRVPPGVRFERSNARPAGRSRCVHQR